MTIRVFSRNGEDVSGKYPEFVGIVGQAIDKSVKNCIVDSEVVAFDYQKNTILPFQVLTTRAKKDVKLEDVKVNCCF